MVPDQINNNDRDIRHRHFFFVGHMVNTPHHAMLVTKVLTAVIIIVAQITALIASQARFYAMCLNVGLAKGYLFLFAPLVASILFYVILPRLGLGSLVDEARSFVILASQLGLLISIYRLSKGNCRNTVTTK